MTWRVLLLPTPRTPLSLPVRRTLPSVPLTYLCVLHDCFTLTSRARFAAPARDGTRAAMAPVKRLAVLSDGTWQRADSATPTNILALARALRQEAPDGTQQVIYYAPGVGAGGSLLSRVRGGAIGAGIDSNIRELYMWLACNYDVGDEVSLFGFSRGSYTVRSLAGMMAKVGLVRQEWLAKASAAYELYRGNVSALTAEDDAEIRALAPDAAAAAFKEKYCNRGGAVGAKLPVKLLACFDTVGALGVPDSVLGGLGQNKRRYLFHDTTLGPHVEHALHALSVDEERGGFRPTVMEQSPDWAPPDDAAVAAKGQLTQLYFPGSHSGVGGGSETEVGLSAYALAWMVREIRDRRVGLAFHEDRLPPPQLDAPPASLTTSERITHACMRLAAGRYVREIRDSGECHPAVAYRFQHVDLYRPPALCMPNKFHKKTPLSDALSRLKLDAGTVMDVLHARPGGISSSDSDSD